MLGVCIAGKPDHAEAWRAFVAYHGPSAVRIYVRGARSSWFTSGTVDSARHAKCARILVVATSALPPSLLTPLSRLGSTGRRALLKPAMEKKKKKERKPILFTLTCFLSHPDKRRQTVACLKSLQKHEPDLAHNCEVLVINEAGKTSGAFLKKQFPWITTVVDKPDSRKGQARSLNLAIQRLRAGKFKFWIHWEESWTVRGPFLATMLEAMQHGIDQLQIITNLFQELHTKSPVRLPVSGRRALVQRRVGYSMYKSCKRSSSSTRLGRNLDPSIRWGSSGKKQPARCWDDDYEHWPLWSLSPGIDRASRVLSVGYFNTDPDFWPVHFELEWAYNWAMQGGVKKAGVEMAFRQKGHRSFSETKAK